MKNLLTPLLLIFTLLSTKAQLPVTDVGLNTLMTQQTTLRASANVTIGKQLLESSAQTAQLTNTYKLMKDAHDKLKKISSFITKFSTVAHILQSQKYQYNRIKGALERFSESKYVTAKDLRVLQHCSSRFLKNTNELIGIANSIVTPGKTEMNDGERINLLIRISEKLDREGSALDYAIRNLEEIEDQRAAMANAQNVLKEVFTGN